MEKTTMIQRSLKICFFSLFFLSVQLITSTYLQAETRYVNDILIISLRTGPDKTYKITKTLKTGTALKVLADKGEFIKVETEGGVTGWVAKYYTDLKLPKAVIIKQQKAKLLKLETKLKKQQEINRHSSEKIFNNQEELNSELENLLAQKRQNDQNYTELSNQYNELKVNYEQYLTESGDIIQTSMERDKLLKENLILKDKITKLIISNKSLENYKLIYWFLAGAGILLIGWLLGRTSKNKTTRTLSL